MSFKEHILSTKKEIVYAFYKRLVPKPLAYDKITRSDIYKNILFMYQKDPELITRLCTMEEINILKKLLVGNIPKRDHGYIDYLLFTSLSQNFLVVEQEGEYTIPSDLLNYIKMALNLFEESAHTITDVIDSLILGLSRIYNCLKLEEFLELLESYYVDYKISDIKKYIKNNPKLNHKVKTIHYKKEEYLISLEMECYKDVLAFQKNFKIKKYTLEEVISIGKYKLNLFDNDIFYYLNFLEVNLRPSSIDLLLEDIIFYCGFDINDENTLGQICDNIEELYEATKKVVSLFPVWIYKGNNLDSFLDNIILPEKNAPCICGSKKKFKNCCEKKFNRGGKWIG